MSSTKTVTCVHCKSKFDVPIRQTLNTCTYCGGQTLTMCQTHPIQ